MKKKALILFSGGLDSTTTIAIAKDQGFEIHALTFTNYSAKQNIEVEFAKKTAKKYNIFHKIITLDNDWFKGSALTESDIPIPTANNIEEIGDEIPVTYVPARNTVFLSIALAYAENNDIYDIFIGANHYDNSHYPDCRPEFIEAFEKLANLATVKGVTGQGKFIIHVPLINMSKGDIIKTGIKLGVDYSQTMTCYNPSKDGAACGICYSCNFRLKGFQENNIQDPASYIR